jgi:flagellar hook protein FlgE
MSVGPATTLGDVLNWLNTSEGTAAVSEKQTLTPSAQAASGTFTLTYDGQTTAAINYDATAAQIKTALETLSNVASGDITVAGTMMNAGTGGVTFTFKNTLGDTNMITMTSSLKDAGNAAITGTFAETAKGFKTQGLLGDGATASISAGKLVIKDNASGYSQSDLAMAWSGNGTLEVPGYFEIGTVGGDEVKNVNISVFDSQGGEHVLSGAFVRTDTANTWDFVLTSISGDVSNIDISGLSNRRISGIEFNASDGSYKGLNSTTGDTAQFEVTFAHDILNPQTIAVDLGTTGQFNGLTQFAGTSTAVARVQDGYKAGNLSTVSVNSEGTLIGAFSNGIKKDIATVQIALFQNTAGLESAGSGYFIPSANSGEAVATQAMSGGAGDIHGGALEKSNADVATEFVNMIQAQNGFQANARTIKVADEILRELTGLIS